MPAKRVSGSQTFRSPADRQESFLALFYEHVITIIDETSPDSVELSVAVLIEAQVLAPLIGSVLVADHGGGSAIGPRLGQSVEDVDGFLRVLVDCEVIDEKELDLQVILQLAFVTGVVVPAEPQHVFHEFRILDELASDLPPAGLHTGCAEKV